MAEAKRKQKKNGRNIGHLFLFRLGSKIRESIDTEEANPEYKENQDQKGDESSTPKGYRGANLPSLKLIINPLLSLSIYLNEEEANPEYKKNQDQEEDKGPTAKGSRGANLFSLNVHYLASF